jgi:hypothetical protein
VANKNPQQLEFPIALRTAAVVQALIGERFKVQLSHSSVSRLLHQQSGVRGLPLPPE